MLWLWGVVPLICPAAPVSSPLSDADREIEIREVEQVIEGDISLQRELLPNRVRPSDAKIEGTQP